MKKTSKLSKKVQPSCGGCSVCSGTYKRGDGVLSCDGKYKQFPRHAEQQLGFIEGALGVELSPHFDGLNGCTTIAFPTQKADNGIDAAGGWYTDALEFPDQAAAEKFIADVHLLLMMARAQSRERER